MAGRLRMTVIAAAPGTVVWTLRWSEAAGTVVVDTAHPCLAWRVDDRGDAQPVLAMSGPEPADDDLPHLATVLVEMPCNTVYAKPVGLGFSDMAEGLAWVTRLQIAALADRERRSREVHWQ